MAGSTQVDVYNIALVALGEAVITSITGTTKSHVILNARWPSFKRSFLADHSWNGTIKTRVLTQLTTTPPGRWDYEYDYPPDALRILSINGNTNVASNGKWAVEIDNDELNRLIRTNETSLVVEYIADIQNIGLLAPLTIEAMGHQLALATCERFGLSTDKAQKLIALTRDVTSAAKAVDSQERSQLQIQSDSIILARQT